MRYDLNNPDFCTAWQRLLEVMQALRAGCPWDRVQTWQSLQPLSIEEIYELADALQQQDSLAVKKELGDVLLHIVFYSHIAAEQDLFDINDVINGLCDKLIRRHPHVFADNKADISAAEVQANWEKQKLSEQDGNDKPASVLAGVPTALPALIKAWRIQQKVSGVGFDWQQATDVFAKIEEEISEFQEHVDAQGNMTNPAEAQAEFGDILFSLVNYARFIGINPEQALEQSNRKFIRRFQAVESLIEADQQAISALDTDALETYWQRVKKQEHELNAANGIRLAK